MKKILILLLAIPFIAAAQDAASLKTAAQQYVDATNKLDVDTFLNMTYPKVFEKVSREDIKKGFANFFTPNEQFSMRMLEVAPNFQFGEIKKIGNQQFCVVRFDAGMEIKFKQDMGDAAEMVKETIKQQMNAKNVTFDKANNLFTIEQNTVMVGVSDETTKGKWMFVGASNGQIESMFSSEVKTQLGL